jgi:hypothetical protein
MLCAEALIEVFMLVRGSRWSSDVRDRCGETACVSVFGWRG